MAEYQVRGARLDDVQAVSKLARSRVGVWQRMDDAGQVQDVAYADLSVYERWLHGGPWMSVETGALQLSHLLRGAGVPLVALNDEGIVGYTELYYGLEPAPYGKHLHIGTLHAHEDHTGILDSLLRASREQAQQAGAQRLTINLAANNTTTIQYYEQRGLNPLQGVRRMMLPARQGQVFYKATEHPDATPTQIKSWHMSIGRLGSARHQWETLWPQTWNAIPQIRARRTHRLKLQAAGNDAFVLVQQQLYLPRYADVYCWTPKPPTGQLITAISDWAHLEGYRKLVFPTVEPHVKTLGLDAEPDGYQETVFAAELNQ